MLNIHGLKLPMIGDEIVAGDVKFVDSGGTKTLDDPGHGMTPDKTFATWDYAIGKLNATGNNGDWIFLLPGHAENIVLTTTVDIDVAGIKHIGLGQGSNRPTFTQTVVAMYVDIAAGNTELRNLLFMAGVNTGTGAMVNVIGDDALIRLCEFKNVSASLHTLHFIEASGANTADRLVIRECLFDTMAAGAGDTDSAISLAEVQDGVKIVGNRFIGNYADAAIHNVTGKVCTNLLIQDNIVENTQAGDHAIELVSACTGLCIDNKLYSDSFATMLDPGSLKCIDNLGSITTDQAGVPIPGPPVIAGEGSNYFTIATSFSSATWNTAAAHEIATVTGLCRLRIVPECTTTLVGGANAGTGEISLGIKDSTALALAATTADNIDALDIWGTSGTTHYQGISYSDACDIISNGDDVGYTIATSALTAGVLTFHIWWEPLETGGLVVAGAGGAL